MIRYNRWQDRRPSPLARACGPSTRIAAWLIIIAIAIGMVLEYREAPSLPWLQPFSNRWT